MTTHTDASRAAAITRAMALAIHAKATELANREPKATPEGRYIPVCVDPDGAGDLTIASLLADAAFRAASEVRA